MNLSEKQAIRVAGLELNALNFSGVMPRKLEGARLDEQTSVVHDVDGTPLFHRVTLRRGRRRVGYADVAVNDVFGEPLLAVALDAVWNEGTTLRRARAALSKRRPQPKYDEARLVTYSFPKLGVQFLSEGKEVLLLELETWAEVPPADERVRDRRRLEPGNFERWSLLEEIADDVRRDRARRFEARVAAWDEARLVDLEPSFVIRRQFELADVLIKTTETREIRYAPRDDDHGICYELRGQQTNVWCVAASVEMILNFFRWRYDQPRIAQELDLGTCDSPNGLPYSQVAKVVTALETLSRKSLDATMITNPGWSVFRDEIRDDRPLISFVPGHSRTVAGYTSSLIYLVNELPYRGLLVYDPWPPTDCDHPDAGGVITRWENFATQVYQFAYTAAPRHV